MKSYAVVDRVDHQLLRRVERLVAAGVDFIQIRDKHAPRAERLSFGAEVLAVARGSGTGVIVNSDVELALEIAAAGVHLPAAAPVPSHEGLSLLGRSCHSLDECVEAVKQRMDYVLLGPVFTPRSKSAASASISFDDLRRAARLDIDIFALGGVTVDTLAAIGATGVSGIAAISLFLVDEPLEAIVEQIRSL